MYKEWVEKAVYVNLYYGRLQTQKTLIEKKISILQKMAEDLIDDGVFNFQAQRTFPMGRQHFSIMINGLSQIANGKKEDLEIKNEIQSNK